MTMLLPKLLITLAIIFFILFVFNKLLGKRKDKHFHKAWFTHEKPSESFHFGLPKTLTGYLITILLMLIVYVLAILVLKIGQ